MFHSTLRHLAAIPAIAYLTLAAPINAQEIEPLDAYQDPHGIDLVSNNVSTSQLPTLSIPAAPELAFSDLLNFMPVIEVTTTGGSEPNETDEIYRVSGGGTVSDGFESRLCTNFICTSVKGTGSRLLLGGDEGAPGGGLGGHRYIQGGSGRQMQFDVETEIYSGVPQSPVRKFLAQNVTNPGGVNLSYQYDSANISGVFRHRPSVVTSTSGYALHFTYVSNSATYNWGMLQSVEIVHVDSPNVALASFDYGGNTVTDIDNRQFACVCMIGIYPTEPEFKGSRMGLPGETGYAFETIRANGSNTRTVTIDGVDYQYVSVPDTIWIGEDDTIQSLTITGPENFYRHIDVTNITQIGGDLNDPPRRRIDSVTDALGNVTNYEYDPTTQRLNRIVYPEGNAVSVDYNSYGNLIERRAEAKPGSGLPDIVQEASYPSTSCLLGFQCFRPQWTQDALDHQTDYTWDTFHGGLLTQLDPVDEQGRRRKTINTWSDTQPINGETCGTSVLIDGSTGPEVCAPRITRTEICETDSAGNELTCGTADSFVQEFTYFEATSLPLTLTVMDGLGNGPLTTTNTYDTAGRVLSSDGPLPGTADASYYHYDVLGRRIWEIGPKNEVGRRSAMRTTYRVSDDQVELVESGHVNGAANLNTFALVRQAETDYNARRLPTVARVREAGAPDPESVLQTSYDSLNRAECSAVRMNPAAFGSLPTSACDLGTSGAHGADRITQSIYDDEGRVVEIHQAVGTTLQRTYATYTFTNNGQMDSMTDARGFRAEMVYDGFGRQTHWYFPNPGAPGVANLADYEQYSYDANGNRTSLRRRDGMTLNFTYDDLNRMIVKSVPDRPDLDAAFERDVYYQYDIRGLQTRARFDSINGDGLTTSYDLYGRVTTNSMTMDGTTRDLDYTYDVAGNRRSITWPDTVTFDYTYSAGGFFNVLRYPGSTAMVNYQYNQRGEVDEVIRHLNAPEQDLTYDNFGRLASSGWSGTTSHDVTWSFTRNPASQIHTETNSSGLFSWDNHPTGTTTANCTANGLNQYTDVSGDSICHDANGNLTADGDWVYIYDVENRLVQMRARVGTSCPTYTSGNSGALGAQMEYDPLGRLYEVNGYLNGTLDSTTQMLYDGDALVAEYDANGTMLARHLHGPAAGVDDPLVSYAGSSIQRNNATFLYSDARGSIVYATDRYLTTQSVNTYDPYGVPGSSNSGRFQYTGQIWLEELGLYYYKARMYSPSLGRFMQTDPIGYEDNSNLYGYVGNDPINAVDPSGEEEFYIGGGGDGYLPGQAIVEDYAANRGTFFTHWEIDSAVEAILTAYNEGEIVVLIGHSWGADSALHIADSVIEQGGNIHLLVTIDAVGNVEPPHVYNLDDRLGAWVNVSGRGHGSFGDAVENLGRMVAGGNETVSYLAAHGIRPDVSIATQRNHEEFQGMMNDARIPEMICSVDDEAKDC